MSSPTYYQEQYARAKAAQAAAEREGDFAQAEAYRQAALRWLQVEARVVGGWPEDEEEAQEAGWEER